MAILTPWIVPNALIEKFCTKATCSDSNFYIQSIMRHDDKNYCVVISGSYPFVENNLREFLKNEH